MFNRSLFRSFITTLTVLLAFPTQAGWENRGVCHVWTGDDPAEAPEDMLTGRVYDFNRNPQGEFFSYSGIYNKSTKGASAVSLKDAMKARGTGAKNPTNSPDVHGQCIQVLKLLMQGKYGILNRLYKLPYDVAAPHFYMAPAKVSKAEHLFNGGRITSSSSGDTPDSDFIESEDKPVQIKADTYQNHASWVALYKGKVIAPKSMKFRFCGAADDFLHVQFAGRNVLETGYYHPEIYRGNGLKDPGCGLGKILTYQEKLKDGKIPGKKEYEVLKLRSAPFCNNIFGGVTCGMPITVEKGKAYPIEIIIANDGGAAMFYLLTQELGTHSKAPLKLFCTNEAEIARPYGSRHDSSLYEAGPSYEQSTDIWEVVSAKGKKKTEKGNKNKFRKID